MVLDTAPDAFITLDRDGVIMGWNAAAQRLFGWSAAEAIGKTMRALILPPEFGDRHDERRNALIASESPLATERFEVEFQRRDGGRFPGEATVSKVDIQGEVFVSGFISDVTERVRREAEREALLREQAARAEAERVAELVAGMQALVDAALAHRTLDGMLSELVTQVRGVLDADAATIYIADESERLSVGASAPADITGGDEFANTVAEAREAMLARDDAGADAGPLVGVPLLAEGEVTAVLVARATPPREFGGEDSRSCGSPPSAWASPSPTRACTSASTGSRRRFSAACCRTACPRCPGSTWRRATSRPPRRPRSAATGTT